MNIDLNILQEKLCELMCAEVSVVPKKKGLFAVETPFYFADGDPYQIYIKERPGGILRLTDMGHTMLHLSYENEIGKFKEGTRGKLFEQIKAETSVNEEDGEFYIDTRMENLGFNIFLLGQALTQLNDLTFLNRVRVESTFYEDLDEQLHRLIDSDKIEKDYYYTSMDNAGDYPIDYKIEGKHAPLFLFGIPNKDKARLATITLERLLRADADFDSLLIFSDQGSLPKADLARLSNVGGEMIASLDAEEDLLRKLKRKVGMD